MNEGWGRKIDGGFFDEKAHTYRCDKGIIRPSVTQIFDLLHFTDFSAINREMLEWKRGFGDSLHKAVELLVKDDLDWDSCDERIIPSICGIEGFLRQIQYKSYAAEEHRVYNLCEMLYGGTVDHRGVCLYQGLERHCIIDLKTASRPEKTWKWQVSAYTHGLKKYDKPWLGIVLKVDREGNVEPFYIDTHTGLREFQVLLATAIIGINNGLYRVGKE